MENKEKSEFRTYYRLFKDKDGNILAHSNYTKKFDLNKSHQVVYDFLESEFGISFLSHEQSNDKRLNYEEIGAKELSLTYVYSLIDTSDISVMSTISDICECGKIKICDKEEADVAFCMYSYVLGSHDELLRIRRNLAKEMKAGKNLYYFKFLNQDERDSFKKGHKDSIADIRSNNMNDNGYNNNTDLIDHLTKDQINSRLSCRNKSKDSDLSNFEWGLEWYYDDPHTLFKWSLKRTFNKFYRENETEIYNILQETHLLDDYHLVKGIERFLSEKRMLRFKRENPNIDQSEDVERRVILEFYSRAIKRLGLVKKHLEIYQELLVSNEIELIESRERHIQFRE